MMENESQFVAKALNTSLKYIYAHVKNYNSVQSFFDSHIPDTQIILCPLSDSAHNCNVKHMLAMSVQGTWGNESRGPPFRDGEWMLLTVIGWY